MAIQSRSETLTFDLLVGLLLPEATRRQAARLSTTDKNTQPLAALAARAGYCLPGYAGHGNNGWGNRVFGRGRVGGPSTSYRSRGKGTIGLSGRFHYCSKEGHWQNECLKRKADLQKEITAGNLAFIGVNRKEIGNSTWKIDSGTSRHLTANHTLLEDY